MTAVDVDVNVDVDVVIVIAAAFVIDVDVCYRRLVHCTEECLCLLQCRSVYHHLLVPRCREES